ncbi:hypothetical protein GlitD10_2291, partial [Gloeomargarita lithophora Alchichica-D10]
MDYQSKTDLETAEDLELLCQTIDEAIEKASDILQKTQQIDEVKKLIQNIETAVWDLKQNEQLLQQTKVECELKLQQLRKAQSDLESLNNLPQRLDQLGIRENVLQDMQRILEDVRESENLLQQALNELQTNQQKIERDKKFIQ